ncbi:MAG: peptidoglycan editing factor PgeF [Sporolactobacillus sp.]|jgi:YfiH family protein|nr:peptidoglycan editing factor PgeF [Sporolactobacillus sp.]
MRTNEPFTVGGQTALLTELPEKGPFRRLAGFSLRSGGVSGGAYTSLNLGWHTGDRTDDVLANRRQLAESIGFPLDAWVCARQVHGTSVVRVTKAYSEAGAQTPATEIEATDGLYTTEPGLLLALCFADCVPIYFYSDHPAAVGIMHAGWRGTVAGAAAVMVRRFRADLGVPPERLHAVIGPAIGGRDYEIDETVAAAVRRCGVPMWRSVLMPHGGGHYLLDLQQLNKLILRAAGLDEKNIQVTHYTTAARPDLFFSYRRDRGRTGRMMGFIGMEAKE